MKSLRCLVLLLAMSCGNERIVQLPEVEQSEITEVLDVSPAYIFYDPTVPDSTVFNRKNIISTTNWLVNIDKRLSLKQVVPHLQNIQAKREKKGMHTNENAKNYFTCNDVERANLGFIEFTEISYRDTNFNLPNNPRVCLLTIENLEKVTFSKPVELQIPFSAENLMMAFNTYLEDRSDKIMTIVLQFNKHLSFQDYVTVKSELLKIKFENITIDSNELIY